MKSAEREDAQEQANLVANRASSAPPLLKIFQMDLTLEDSL